MRCQAVDDAQSAGLHLVSHLRVLFFEGCSCQYYVFIGTVKSLEKHVYLRVFQLAIDSANHLIRIVYVVSMGKRVDVYQETRSLVSQHQYIAGVMAQNSKETHDKVGNTHGQGSGRKERINPAVVYHMLN